MQTDEKTPQSTPINMAKMKPRITSPPKMNIINSVKKVVPLVLIVRANVELIASFMWALRVRFGYSLRYSRTRSKITTVALME